MEALMERIRNKSDQFKSLPDTAKSMRMIMADRRHSLDVNEKAILRSCLDSLQTTINVRSVAGMSERLETTARQLSLQFMKAPSNPGLHTFYLSTEMYYVEIGIDDGGSIQYTNIQHQNMQTGHAGSSVPPSTQASPEMTKCLSEGDFATFVKHLEGLSAVYDLPNCSQVDKSRAWQALWTLEQDLLKLSGYWVTDPNEIVHKTDLGMVHERQGGLPMKLRIFLAPYELLDTNSNSVLPLTKETVVARDLGTCATVTIKPSVESYSLPLKSVMPDAVIGQSNSVPLPAHFALTLDTPLPTSVALIRQIVAVTDISWLDLTSNTPLLSLIARKASDGSLDPSGNRGLFVTLPDQQHCYFMTETAELEGQLVSMIPFRHPNQVRHIVDILRRQVLFNTLVSSCVRANSLEDVDTSTMFEVTCLDPTCSTLTITFEHPNEETMATAELNLSSVVQPRCRVYTTGSTLMCSEQTASKVLKRSLSIPITMRSVTRRMSRPSEHKTEPGEEIPVSDLFNFEGMDGGDQKNMQSGISAGRIHNRIDSNRGSSLGSSGGGGTPAVCDPGGGPGGGRVKQEAMETDASSQDLTNVDSLNRYGPQGADLLPGARTTPKNKLSVSRGPEGRFRLPSPASSVEQQSSAVEARRKSEPTVKSELSDIELDTDLSFVKQFEAGKARSKDRREIAHSLLKPFGKESSQSIKPSVSITPIPEMGTEDTTLRRDSSKPSGIEIIPLGGPPSINNHGKDLLLAKSKARDLKRSLSEDDKRRLQKKEKKRKEDRYKTSSSSTSKDHSISIKSGAAKKDPKEKLAGVIERLAFQTSDSITGIEIKPTTAAGCDPSKPEKSAIDTSVEITLDRVKPDKEKSKASNDRSSSPSGLKLTIKNSKHKHDAGSSPSYKSSSSGGLDKKYNSQGHKSSSSSSSSGSKSSSPKLSGSSSGRSSPYSKEKRQSGSKSHEKKKDSDFRQEEFKKLLSGNKLDKAFQIPKLSKPDGKSESTTSGSGSHSRHSSPGSSPKTSSGGKSSVGKASDQYSGGSGSKRPDDPQRSSSKPDGGIKLPAGLGRYEDSGRAERQTASPTLSVHIVKSPAPLPVASPRSQMSPLEQKELMEEGLLLTK